MWFQQQAIFFTVLCRLLSGKITRRTGLAFSILRLSTEVTLVVLVGKQACSLVKSYWMSNSNTSIETHTVTLRHAHLTKSTLVISTLFISNNRLSRRQNLVHVLTWKSNNRLQNIAEKRRNWAICPLSTIFFNRSLVSYFYVLPCDCTIPIRDWIWTHNPFSLLQW